MAKQASAKRERCRADEESTHAALGRNVARFMKMYGNSKLALMQVLNSSQSDQEERRQNPSAPDPHADDQALLDYITDQCPTLGGMVDDALGMQNPVKELNKLASDIDEGWSEARNTDTASLKKGFAVNFNLDADYDKYGHWVPPLNPTKRHLWGPVHRQLFPLIVPYSELESLKQAGATVSHDHWYDWMWKGRKHDPENLDEGFLQGDLLIKAFLSVYFSSVINPRPSQLATARKGGFTGATVHSIAYTATLLRFTLSCEPRIDQTFNSAGFYQHLVQYLEHEDQRELTVDILKWWNRNIFSAGVANTMASEPNASDTWELATKREQNGRQPRRFANNSKNAEPTPPPPPPLPPLPLLLPRTNTSSHSTPDSDLWAGQNWDLGDSAAEPEAEQPAKKTKWKPSTRLPDTDNESDLDGKEVQEEMECMGAAQRKQKTAKANGALRPDARRSSRKKKAP
ncbi:hypothetical protein M407DRAFT_12343 [Tulasnella calospora MUT 4182]|uniref:Uncharacterized protein n=1 Tax=Tulasnella calospora MUT 4182 TaxID=1051891 RepID=A0A0C3Q3Z4_9AGAM|nr:hypothetical protein M407DRAFT_12343 [Tulasnella calospora MUT 4182]